MQFRKVVTHKDTIFTNVLVLIMEALKVGLFLCWLFAWELNQARNIGHNITYECIYNLGNIYNNDGECVLYGYNNDSKYKYFITGNKLNNINCNIQYKCIISNNINIHNNVFSICDDKLYEYSYNVNKWLNKYRYDYKNNNFYVFSRRYKNPYISGENVTNITNNLDIIKHSLLNATKNS